MKKQLFGGADKNLFEHARRLRKTQTPAEDHLWQYLRQKPMGYKFRRQHPYGVYILDFYCFPLRLAIEVDGGIHNLPEVQQQDQQRQLILEQAGVTVMRFPNEQIMTELAAVINHIESTILKIKHG